MRKALDIVSLAGLAVLTWITADALAGPHRLRGPIPTHFDLGGQPNGWGTPWVLLFLPITATVLYILMTFVARFPDSFSYPTRVTRANIGRLQSLALNMIAWLKAEVVWLFACIQTSVVHAARTGQSRGIWASLMPMAVGIVLGTIVGYLVVMRRSS